MKKLLILNGSFSEITLIQAAKKLGYYVITSGNNPQLIGHQYADEYIPADYLPVSTKDIPKMYEELVGYVKSIKNPYLKKNVDATKTLIYG